MRVEEGCIDREGIEIGLHGRGEWGGIGESQERWRVRKRCRRRDEKAGRGDQYPH